MWLVACCIFLGQADSIKKFNIIGCLSRFDQWICTSAH